MGSTYIGIEVGLALDHTSKVGPEEEATYKNGYSEHFCMDVLYMCSMCYMCPVLTLCIWCVSCVASFPLCAVGEAVRADINVC